MTTDGPRTQPRPILAVGCTITLPFVVYPSTLRAAARRCKIGSTRGGLGQMRFWEQKGMHDEQCYFRMQHHPTLVVVDTTSARLRCSPQACK
eukprot:1147512-Pleurochrysis_carterae.AAC.3